MQRVFLWLCLLVAASMGCSALAEHPPFSNQPYEARYALTKRVWTTGRTSSYIARFTYDGRGNLRVEHLDPNGKVVGTVYYLRSIGKAYRLEADNLAVEIQEVDKDLDPFVFDWRQAAIVKTREKIGLRDVSNHPSHGFRGEIMDIKGDVWIADDLGIPTLLIGQLPEGIATMQLLGYGKRDFTTVPALKLPNQYRSLTAEQYLAERSGRTRQVEMPLADRVKLESFLAFIETMARWKWDQLRPPVAQIIPNKPATASFKLGTTGRISGLKLLSSSGSPVLDDFVLQSVGSVRADDYGPKGLTREYAPRLSVTYMAGQMYPPIYANCTVVPSAVPLLDLTQFCLGIVGASRFPGKGSSQAWARANQFYERALTSMSMSNFHEAVNHLEAAVVLYPHDYNFYKSLAIALLYRGDKDDKAEAQKASTRCLELCADNSQVWICAGLVNEALGQFALAKKAWENALKFHPSLAHVELLNEHRETCSQRLLGEKSKQ